MKLLKQTLILSLGALLVVSCTKERMVEPQKPQHHNEVQISNQNTSDANDSEDKKKNYTTNDKDNGSILRLVRTPEIDCVPSGRNCFEPFIVVGATESSFNDFNNAVSGNEEAIGDYFTGNNWEELFNDLTQNEIDKLQSYDYDVVELEGAGEHIRYYFAGIPGSEGVDEYNFDFVMQLDESEIAE